MISPVLYNSYTARRAEEGVTIDNNPDGPVFILKAEGALGVTNQPVENLEDDTNTKIENGCLEPLRCDLRSLNGAEK